MAEKHAIDSGLLDRLLAAAAAYRTAYGATEAAIAQHFDDPDSRLWVFNLADWDDEALTTLHPVIQRAERRRRQSQVALHAVSELLALENPAEAMESLGGPPPIVTSADAIAPWANAEAPDGSYDRWMRALDRFVGIVNGADAGDCIYLDGTFVPVEHHHDGDDEVTMVDASRSEL